MKTSNLLLEAQGKKKTKRRNTKLEKLTHYKLELKY